MKELADRKKTEGVDIYAPYRQKNRATRRARIEAGIIDPPRRRHPEKYKAWDQARRARKLGLEHESFTSREIFRRDNWTCGICSELVDPELKYPNPRSASLDHVVPLSRGGGHTRANTRCSHLECNVARGNRVDDGSL